MLQGTEAVPGAVIPGEGNYQAINYNGIVRRELVSLVLLSAQTLTGSNYLQLVESINRTAITCQYHTQDDFTSNIYTLVFGGYKGVADPGIDPLALPSVSVQTYEGLSQIKEGAVIVFLPIDDSIDGTQIQITIPGTTPAITDIPVVAPTYESGATSYRPLNKAGDFRKNEPVTLLFDGTQFIVSNIQANDISRLINEGYVQTGFNPSTNEITLTAVSSVEPSELYEGMQVNWIPTDNIQDTRTPSPGGVTLTVGGFNKPLVRRNGVKLNPNDITTDNTASATYHASSGAAGEWYLDSLNTSRIKQDYDAASYWDNYAGGAAGTPSDTLYILQPSDFDLGNSIITTQDNGTRTIKKGMRINFKPDVDNAAGTVTLRLIVSGSVAQGTYPNIYPDLTIKQADGTDLSASDLQENTLTELVCDGTDFLIEQGASNASNFGWAEIGDIVSTARPITNTARGNPVLPCDGGSYLRAKYPVLSSYFDTAGELGDHWVLKDSPFNQERVRFISIGSTRALAISNEGDSPAYSNNSGELWNTSVSPSSFQKFCVKLTPDDVLCISAGKGTTSIRSTDGGVIWSNSIDVPGNSSIFAIAIRPDRDLIIVGDANGDLNRSIDRGLSYSSQISTALDRCHDIAMTSNSSIIVAVGNTLVNGQPTGGIIRSTNNGIFWSNNITNNFTDLIRSVAMTTDGSLIVAGGRNGEISRSLDGGLSWSSLIDNPLRTSDIVYSMAMSSNGDIILACTSEGRIIKSTDGGITWKKISNTPFENGDSLYAITMDQAGTYALVCGDNGAIAKSIDNDTTVFNVPSENYNSNYDYIVADIPVTL